MELSGHFIGGPVRPRWLLLASLNGASDGPQTPALATGKARSLAFSHQSLLTEKKEKNQQLLPLLLVRRFAPLLKLQEVGPVSDPGWVARIYYLVAAREDVPPEVGEEAVRILSGHVVVKLGVLQKLKPAEVKKTFFTEATSLAEIAYAAPQLMTDEILKVLLGALKTKSFQECAWGSTWHEVLLPLGQFIGRSSDHEKRKVVITALSELMLDQKMDPFNRGEIAKEFGLRIYVSKEDKLTEEEMYLMIDALGEASRRGLEKAKEKLRRIIENESTTDSVKSRARKALKPPI